MRFRLTKKLMKYFLKIKMKAALARLKRVRKEMDKILKKTLIRFYN